MSSEEPVQDGGPAFPVGYKGEWQGMSLRDYIAIKAMAAFIRTDSRAWIEKTYPRHLSEMSFVIADAMISRGEGKDT